MKNPRLEPLFVDADRHLSDLEKRVAAMAKAVAAAGKASKAGDVRAMSKSMEVYRAAVGSIGELEGTISDLLKHDFAAEIRDGALVEEVQALASDAGFRGVRVVHGEILSFPVILEPKADDLTVKIGKKRFGGIRPSALLEQLVRLRKRRSSGGSVRFVEAIEGVFLRLTDGHYQRSVPLGDVYKLLTPLPAQRNDYSELEFVSDLYALERGGEISTKSGRRLTFPASTSTLGGKAIRIATEDGEERLYSSIRFD